VFCWSLQVFGPQALIMRGDAREEEEGRGRGWKEVVFVVMVGS